MPSPRSTRNRPDLGREHYHLPIGQSQRSSKGEAAPASEQLRGYFQWYFRSMRVEGIRLFPFPMVFLCS
jgi:hypothetical protein